MIHVKAVIADGHTSLVVDGHEGHVEQGRVCAAASAVMHAAVLGLQELAHHYPHIVTIEIEDNDTC
ncbi:MAG TPA: hypothetical protein VFH54_06115 [Mycobacteriales bacterium]|nr:hypothetical protein [Mycobacteriales bacterium]